MRIDVQTASRTDIVDVTREVQRCVTDLGASSGVAVVFCPHTTAAITINENADPDVVRDLIVGFERVAPRDAGYLHREGNSDGHILSSLVGPSLTVPVRDGRLMLGTWQDIYLCEFDGPRTRRLEVTVVPGLA